MNSKKVVYFAIAIGAVIVFGIYGTQNNEENVITKNRVFHVTLASPDNYKDGVFIQTFKIDEGIYEFDFVPNGDSPENMIISLKGESFSFSEKFRLFGTPHETGVSTYFTWDYYGIRNIQITNQQELTITIDPNGDLFGPVSVDIIRK
jgi:hypothetical protein